MPLRDHFRPPLTNLASWEELHGMWPSPMAIRLNAILPEGYRSGMKVHLGTAAATLAGEFEHDGTRPPDFGQHGLDWRAAAPTLMLDTDESSPPEYEVRVYDRSQSRRLVAAVEIVSPGNKDRSEARDAFVSKCHALLQQEVCVVIVDPVTVRAANLYAELAARMGAKPPATANASLYAVSCRAGRFNGRYRVEAWEHTLSVGSPLPTLPLWFSETRYVPLELERTYEEACRGLRIARQ